MRSVFFDIMGGNLSAPGNAAYQTFFKQQSVPHRYVASNSVTIAFMMMAAVQSDSAQRVQKALERLGLGLQVEILPSSTRSAQEAAQAIGCTVSQIAKSLVFQTVTSNRPVLVIASGSNRVDEKIISQRVGESIQIGDGDFVRRMTGFAIGGVPPTGHNQQIETYIDQDLLVYDEIWAAAGTPHAVFKLTGEVLIQITGGIVLQLAC